MRAAPPLAGALLALAGGALADEPAPIDPLQAPRQCVEWIASARHARTPEHFYRIGLCYRNGWGVEKDGAAADAWLRRAAERGHAGARRELETGKPADRGG